MRLILDSRLFLIGLSLIGLCAAAPATAARTAKAPPQAEASASYRVKSGDSLARIAKKTGTSVAQLQQLNQLTSSALKPGQILRLQTPPARQSATIAGKNPERASTTREPAVAGAPSHRVKKGESLYQIARKHRISVADLQRWNRLSGTALKPGQSLLLAEGGELPKAATAGTQAAPAAQPAADAPTHTVAKGETLYQIARQRGLAVEELVRLNGLRGHRIHPGQQLALPAAEPATADSDLPPEPAAAVLAQQPAAGNDPEADGAVPDQAAQSDPEASCPQPVAVDLGEAPAAADAEPKALARTIARLRELPYRFGGNGVNGIDCSGFVQRVFREFDIDLPRSAREQYRLGAPVQREALQQGDLLFFRTYAKYPSHVGIYLGDNKMVHASTRSRKVVISDITQAYYRRRYIGAKRLVALAPESLEVDSMKGLLQEEPDEETSSGLSNGRKAALPQTRPVARPG
jgi:peptidoglycan DL-endopeptidase LytE